MNNEAIASFLSGVSQHEEAIPERPTTVSNTESTHRSMEVVQTTTTTTAAVSKRKRITISTGGITTSLSDMSLTQPSMKRSRAAITTADIIMETKANEKPNYLHVPDHVFRKMLSTALEGTEDNLLSSLDTTEKLQYARTYARLTNDLFYLRLKEDFWKYYSLTLNSSSSSEIIDFRNLVIEISSQRI